MTLPAMRLKALGWTPYLPPVEMETATERQLEAMKVTPSARKISSYVRTLAHDPDSYEARTILFNAIMYAEGGLPRADRELGALAASLINGCAFCANVHARRHIELAGSSDTVAAIWTGQRHLLSERDTAIMAYAEALSVTPVTAGPAEIEALRQVGMDDGEILDLAHAVAIFGWANRLMHPLGHPN